MRTFLDHFFHNKTNDRTEGGLVCIPTDRNDWPEAWKKIEYKNYNIFDSIGLPFVEGNLFNQVLSQRRSSGKYVLDNKLTLEAVSYILRCGYGLQSRDANHDKERGENRTVPSGGKRYPLEVYIFLFKRMDGLKPGIYHYSVKDHALEPVSLRSFSSEDMTKFSPLGCLKMMNGIVCLSSVFRRMSDKYGSRGYRYVLLEAGHVAQNMLLAGTERAVNLLPAGGVNESTLESAIGLNSDEKVVYSLFW